MMLPKSLDDMELDYNHFIDSWGVKKQLLKTLGEMHELGEVLCREILTMENAESGYKFYQEPSYQDLLTEIADVYLMVDQLSFIYGREGVKAIIADKLQKALRRVDEFDSMVMEVQKK